MLRVLSIAGSDSGGGAGIQADLKTITALGAHGMTAVTALTAQNTLGFDAIDAVPADLVRAQIRAVVGDIGVDAVKVGMLATAEIADVVADELAALPCPIVVDPVMVATSGARLLDANAVDLLRRRLLPLATVVTPNLAEARILAGDPSANAADAAAALAALGARAVVVTGGAEDGVDWFRDASGAHPIEGPLHRVDTTHGSGCAHSAALAVFLARNASSFDAAAAARAFAAAAIQHGPQLGYGHGPVNATAAAASM